MTSWRDRSRLGLSLDDFGTGFSVQTHLKALPVEEVKIDRSFVTHMTSDSVDEAIVNATIQLAHSIGIRVVAEGIEDQATWHALAQKRCDLVQGYALSKPLPAAELDALLCAVPRVAPETAPRRRLADPSNTLLDVELDRPLERGESTAA